MIAIEAMDACGKGKYRVRFDNGYLLTMYHTEIRIWKAEIGSIYTEEQFDTLLKDTVGKRTKKRTMHLLEQMDRTEQQLRDKLKQAEYPQVCIEEAIAYVKKFRYLDDQRYASDFVRYRQHCLSRQQIKQKLMAKGIRRELIDSVIDEEYQSDERCHIRELLKKKHYSGENCDETEFRRIYQYLLRRGFSVNDILKEMKSGYFEGF